MMKGVRDKNLYYLKSSTVTCALTTSVDSDNDATKLWHMSFGHTGEKSMQALAKQIFLKVLRSASWNSVSTVYWASKSR